MADQSSVVLDTNGPQVGAQQPAWVRRRDRFGVSLVRISPPIPARLSTLSGSRP
jgi:hypothetical protein